ncbi:hypothetical protein GQ600_23627 [Phytophthora cactorum]|nr:hypothetical protein GQ600_23627 [Phytophthora cactorum]
MAHVVACRFLRLGCSEEDHPLFRREYARYEWVLYRQTILFMLTHFVGRRNNRERGVKVRRDATKNGLDTLLLIDKTVS